jgi:hypothetical protein
MDATLKCNGIVEAEVKLNHVIVNGELAPLPKSNDTLHVLAIGGRITTVYCYSSHIVKIEQCG